MAGEFKNFLYVFCGKRKTTATYTYEAEEDQFYCEVGLHSFNPNSISNTTFIGEGQWI